MRLEGFRLRERTPGAPAATPAGDRLTIGTALAVLVVMSWFYLVYLAHGMTMEGPDAGGHAAWRWVELGTLVVMWIVMTVAMMTPSAAPMVLVFTGVHRRRAAQGRPTVPTVIFVLGYLAVWTGFSVLTAIVQAVLHSAMLLSPAMATTSPLLSGALFVAAGAFQWTPLKRACLANCRSPLSFVMSEWREGHRGALVMGLRHGAYCLGCCWALMFLLFVAGVMNLLWVGIIAVAVLLEKVLPRGDLVGRVAGLALVAIGLNMAGAALGI